MASCVAFGCTNRNARKGTKQLEFEKDNKITFHKFPKDTCKRLQWIRAVRRENWEPSTSSVLCSCHFTEDCFDRTSLCCVRLQGNAVPTIFPAHPPHLQKTQKKRKLPRSLAGASTIFPDGGEEEIPAKQVHHDSPEKRSKSDQSTSISPGKFSSPSKQCLRSKLHEIGMRYKRKLKTLRQSNRRLRKKVAHLDSVIECLKNKSLVNGEGLDLLRSIAGSNKELLKRQLAKLAKTAVPKTYSKELRTFAITLHYYSPRAYCYVRSHFNSCLPHPKTIGKWYSCVNGEPGFTAEAFHAVKIRASQESHEIVCSLIFDEMAVRKLVDFDGRGYHGFVDTGSGVDSDEWQLAKEALVFMLVAVNASWKVPVGYFLVDGVNAEQKANLVLQCIKLAEESGIRIVSVTFDGTSTNFSMAKELGCSLDPAKPLKTWFIPPGGNYRISIFPDPSHMIKLVRNALGEKRVLVDNTGGVILWEFFEKLHHIQEQEGLHLGNKLKSSHILYQNQKMKVSLATQLLSRSVADAMEFLSRSIADAEFQGSLPTARFVNIMNDLFDVLNSKNIRQLDIKKPICEENHVSVLQFFDEAEQYLRSLKLNTIPVIYSCRKTGFLGFIICIESSRILYNDLCSGSGSPLKYIPTYKFSQDHLEFFFGNIRMHGGFNNNPSARQFKSVYKKCLVHMELKPSSTGNAIPLEEITMLNCSSVKIINATSRMINLCSEEGEDVLSLEPDTDHVYLFHPQELTEFARHIIIYIAGFVIRRLSKDIKCEDCLNSLSGNSENLVDSLIHKKDRGGLLYPSNNVIQVCIICEKVIRTALAESGGKFLLQKFTVSRLVYFALKNFVNSKTHLFAHLDDHSNDQEPLSNHRIHLIRAISEVYFEVCVHYVCKKAVDRCESKRKVWNKLVLFKGY